jgi:hypothetical protein
LFDETLKTLKSEKLISCSTVTVLSAYDSVEKVEDIPDDEYVKYRRKKK